MSPRHRSAGRIASAPAVKRPGKRGWVVSGSTRWPHLTTWTACVLLALATIAAYSNTFHCPFAFDDHFNITDNKSIQQLWPVWRVFSKSLLAEVPIRSRPLVNLSLAVNYATGGLDPFHYHLTNVAIHTLAGLVLFELVRRTLALPKLRERYGEVATPLAFVIAALWTLHPLQTEAVTYVIQRCESMMGLFFLLAVYCVVFSEGSARPRRWEAAAVLACLASMGCKEVAVSAPLVILLCDRAFLAGSFREAWRRRRGMYLGLGGCWIALGILLLWSGGPVVHEGQYRHIVSSVEYARSQSGVILHYLRLSFWPYPQVCDYDWPVARTVGEILPGVVVVGGLLAASVWALVRWPKWGAIGAWFFLILAPTSSILPLKDLAFEHRMYLSLAAVLTAGVIVTYELLKRLSVRLGHSTRATHWCCLVPALVGIVGLGGMTYIRNEVYQTQLSLWRDVVEKAPHNDRARYNLGFALSLQGKTEEAIEQYRRALEINPGCAEAHLNLGFILSKQGKTEEALEHHRQALAINPGDADAYYNLGLVLSQQGKAEEALEHYRRALETNPRFANAHLNLGLILFRQGKTEEAIEQYRRALAINPGYAEAHYNLGNILSQQGKTEEAFAQYRTALELKPSFLEARLGLGTVLYAQGRPQEAVAQWQEVLHLRPKDAFALNLLAQALATCPDKSVRNGPEAVALAQRAVQISGGQSPELLGTLAAAYAELGRFPEAVATAQQAFTLASGRGDKRLANSLEAQIRLYQSGSASGAPSPTPGGSSEKH